MRDTERRLDLVLIPFLHALLTERNVSRAASACGVGQPDMSKALRRLRASFNDDDLLITKGPAAGTLTPRGASLVSLAADAAASARALVAASAEFEPSTSTRKFRVLASDYVHRILVRRMRSTIREEAPQVQIEITPVQPGYAESLRGGTIDALVLPDELDDLAHFPRVRLFDDEFVLAFSKDNTVLTPGGSVTREQFLTMPHVQYTAHGHLPSLAERRLQCHGLDQRNVVWIVETWCEIPGMLEPEHLGNVTDGPNPHVAVMHKRMVQTYPHLGWVPLPTPTPLRPISEVLLAPTSHTGPDQRWLYDHIRDAAAHLPPLHE